MAVGEKKSSLESIIKNVALFSLTLLTLFNSIISCHISKVDFDVRVYKQKMAEQTEQIVELKKQQQVILKMQEVIDVNKQGEQY